MVQQPRSKWRPPLGLIVAAVLLTVLVLPLLAVFFALPTTGPNANRTADVALALGLVVLATVGLGFVFVRALTQPVGELTERTRRLMAGDRAATKPLTWHGSEEIAALSHGLFSMADGLFDRADYISTFATHVSHEIKTPLTSIRGAVELLLDGDEEMPPVDRRRFLENALADTVRITALIERLQELARADVPQDRGESTVGAVLDGIQGRFPNLSLNTRGRLQDPIAMSAENLEIVFSNLMENAAQHDATLVRVVITAHNGAMQLVVTDDGYGISRGNEDRIFDLFFTTRRAAGGTGMGLGIVRTILRAHGGDIRLTTEQPASGASFDVTVPLAHAV